MPEISRKPASSQEGVDLDKLRAFRPGEPRPGPPELPMNVSLPAVLNGQILPGASDRYRFQASKGQRIVTAASARELIPYIADAVPGWFQAAISICDADGKELSYADHFRFRPDPVLCFDVPKDGEYILTIRDSLYRGREDFVYRITIGELPYVTSIFPLGCQAGKQTSYEVRGWNLSASPFVINMAWESVGAAKFQTRKDAYYSNAVPLAVDASPSAPTPPPELSSSGAAKKNGVCSR